QRIGLARLLDRLGGIAYRLAQLALRLQQGDLGIHRVQPQQHLAGAHPLGIVYAYFDDGAIGAG
ncbi:hypothetical protein RF55_22617, partial [Lasius niger]